MGSLRAPVLSRGRSGPVLRGVSFVAVEETPEPLATADAAVGGSDAGGEGYRVAQSLVVALRVVVLDELADDAAQMTFAERDDVAQALLLDRADEPLRVGVQIRAARRQPQERHPRHVEKALQVRGVERISIHDEVTVAAERPGHGIGEIASDLRHPGPIGVGSDAGNVNASGLEVMTNSTR